MERFIVSLAIRCALVEITSLPKPSFLAIDEGFGALDDDNIINVEHIFNYMRGKFDFVIAVSHVNSMRDMVDGLINININEDGFSEVVSI
jgi:DNA repair exonuclease SbcCD ATPase subunit